ncbi:hypothetical protein ACFQ4N_10360 [Oceanobacillus iheyensis]|uniref:Uncharacterized protein n=1 Tax=Oceanobacillus iheyensis (strain DSM 14371 / CIP 107618 / JCM 11309 / KCTC 3954 / HTE831) TaxID=221109 RepID=Q8ERB2_OCEIH|nr:hypothetical protein [Oceanobacillus iheyensis]BAC13350.1 hypothetical protein [Oceanobacillus iheyensis HTE831]
MLLNDIITFGNIGIDELYVYIILFFLFCMLVYYFIRPLSLWAINKKMHRLISYVVVTLLLVICILMVTNYMGSVQLHRALKVGLQISAFFGFCIMIISPIMRFLQKPVK